MNKSRLVLAAGALAAGAFCLGIPAVHAAGPEIASLAAGPTALVWQPAAAYERMTLTVSGPDGVFTREFDRATMPSLDLYGADGYPLADGAYAWELRAAPVVSDEARAALARARETGDESIVAELRRAGKIPAEPLVVSGHFRVHDGAFVRADLDEPAAAAGDAAGPGVVTDAVTSVHAADQVIPDDLIVQGSICAGLDCVNGEDFGFDTIRMKENNTRVQFFDTSVGSFPTNNWQIRANSSTSGAASFLAFVDQGANGSSETGTINFQVTAGAPANSLVVGSTGRVGLRTATPVLDLHINTSNTPGIRLEQNSSGGFTAQTWDVAGNEANFFVRDVTGGSRLSFRIRPGAPTSSLDIAADGDVGIGTASPEAPLEVERSGLAAGVPMLQLEHDGDIFFRQKNSTSGQFVDLNLIGNDFRINFGTGGGGPELILTNNGNLTITGAYAPDYVFEPDYPLMPLDDLAAFIEENKHLPNVPSDAEVKATGRIVVNEFQMQLLEKIEELVLYTLEQHDTITAQQASIAALQTEVAAIKAAAKID